MVRTPAERPTVVEGLRLVRLVGQGGEGEVWEAIDPFDRRRALKLVTPDCLAPPAEAAIRGAWLVRIDHPSLVRVHRSGVLGWAVDRGGMPQRRDRTPPQLMVRDGDELSGWGFVEMDFIDGQSLASTPADFGVLWRLRPLAEALDLLHAGYWSDGVPLVHRDVKPANLVAGREGRLVLVDFSTLRGVDAGEGTRVGTPLYCAPEAFVGSIAPAVDVYSFAVTTVALVTGQRGRHLAASLRDPHGAGIPPILVRALSFDPRERPVSCRAILQELTARSAPRPERTAFLAAEPTRQTAYAPSPAPVPYSSQAPGPLQPASRDEGAWSPPPDAGQEPATAVFPWVTVAFAVVAVPAAAAASGQFLPQELLVVGLGAAVAHVAAHLMARMPVSLALALPPVSWALLLGHRTGATQRERTWATSLLLPGCVGMAAAIPIILGTARTPEYRATLAALTGALGLVFVLLGVAAVRTRAGPARGLRILTLPLWLAGAAVFVGLGLLILPIALLTRRAGDALRFMRSTLAGAAEIGRMPS